MIEDNINEVRYLAANEAVTRRFFLVLQHESRMKTRAPTIEAIAERLRDEEQTARRYLDMCGLEVRDVEYADNFLLGLFHGMLNKRTALHSKLPTNVFDMVSTVSGVTDEEFDNLMQGSDFYDEQAKKA